MSTLGKKSESDEVATVVQVSENHHRVAIRLHFSRPCCGEDVLLALHELIEQYGDDPELLLDFTHPMVDDLN